jgi:hypothetical protein
MSLPTFRERFPYAVDNLSLVSINEKQYRQIQAEAIKSLIFQQELLRGHWVVKVDAILTSADEIEHGKTKEKVE